MYNNEVTYAPHWNTPENKAALEKLESKYFDKSEAYPDCPVSWAPEVLELMDKLEKELGFLHNTSTLRGYYVQGTLIDWFITNPWINLFSAIKYNVFTDDKIPILKRVKRIVSSFLHPIKYGIKATKVLYINPLLNKIEKPKIRLGQIKEKYGELRCYFDTAEAYQEYVDQEVRKTELKLALKGVYYPIESFYNSSIGYSVGTEYNPDTISTTVDQDGTISVSKTTYRKLMKDLGLNLDEIKQKYEIRYIKEKTDVAE